MTRAPKNPKEMLPEVTKEYRGIFGDELISLILYGSAAGPDYDPGRSDVNLMIVLRKEGLGRLEQAFGTVRKWCRKGFAVPLFLSERYIATSLDVFPIEYLNFGLRYEMVYGKDVLRGLEPDPNFLRLQCEREIKGKLLLLRQGFVESGGKRDALETLISRLLGALAAIFRALAVLDGVELPDGKRALFREISNAFGLDGALFERLLDVRERKIRPGRDEMQALCKRCLVEMEKLSDRVDAMGG